VDFGGQSSSGSAQDLIVRFVLLMPPPFRPVAAACWWARTSAGFVAGLRP
jgi:hypothetical protein